MMQRVQKEGITKQTNIDADCEAIADLSKIIDLNNYKNMCWDKHHRILKFEEVM